MLVIKLCPVLVVSFAALAFAGCSSGDGGAPGPTGEGPTGSDGPTGTAKTGITECGSVHCQAGSHCEDDRYGDCGSGCTTDNNCPGDQKCGGGACLNGASPKPPTKKCDRVAAMDGECDELGLHNAYRCTDTSPPHIACKLHPNQVDYPGGYCCPF